MSGQFPTTPFTLLTRLREPGDGHYWQVSWKRFLELYHEPLAVTARACLRSACRRYDDPRFRYVYFGFRVVLVGGGG